MLYKYTYGTLPTKEEFYDACKGNDLKEAKFFNDERVGTDTLTLEELWDELNKAEHEGTEKSLDWCSYVLSVISIEWV